MVLIVAAVIGGGVFWWFRNRATAVTATVQRGGVVEELILSGEVKAEEHAELSFQSSGELVYIGVSEGDQVSEGQLLAKLETVTLNAAYQQALSNLRAAEANVQKIHDEVKDHDKDETFTQKVTRTNAEVAKDNAYEAVIIARRNLRNAGLVAPFDGTVVKITNPFSGINTTFSQSQVELVNFETIYFEVSADQTEVTQLSLGQEVEIVLDAFEDETLKGIVDYIGSTPKAGEVGTIYEIKVRFVDNNLNRLKIGMTGDAKFVTERKENVLYVDPAFLSSDKDGSYLTVDGKRKVYVTTGLEGDDRTEVSGEIREGMTIYD